MSEIKNKSCVIKVQQSLAHYDPNNPDAGTQILVYDKDRDFMYEGPIPNELKALMGERPKIYCNAMLLPELDDNGQPDGTFRFAIIEETEDQSW